MLSHIPCPLSRFSKTEPRSRPGQGAYYVDGMRLDGSLDIPTAAIYSMKIHNGGIPAAFGNTTSAVVVIETKSYYNMFE